jgi:hypothetical protein
MAIVSCERLLMGEGSWRNDVAFSCAHLSKRWSVVGRDGRWSTTGGGVGKIEAIELSSTKC